MFLLRAKKRKLALQRAVFPCA